MVLSNVLSAPNTGADTGGMIGLQYGDNVGSYSALLLDSRRQ